jgi:GNAT superfamily N-acetyltransferase
VAAARGRSIRARTDGGWLRPISLVDEHAESMPHPQIRRLRLDPGGSEVEAVAALARAEGWPTFADPALVRQLAAAPGTLTVVAVDESPPSVVGFAHALTNGHHAYLSVMVVARPRRGGGVGRRLVESLFEISGVQRIDLLSGSDSEGFYERLPSRSMAGYRLYPERSDP